MNTPPPENDPRLIELETRLAFQDRTIEELSDVVLDLRADIDRLRRELHDALRGLEERLAEGSSIAHDPPPHW